MACIHVDKDAKIVPHPPSGKGDEREDIHTRIDELAADGNSMFCQTLPIFAGRVFISCR